MDLRKGNCTSIIISIVKLCPKTVYVMYLMFFRQKKGALSSSKYKQLKIRETVQLKSRKGQI